MKHSKIIALVLSLILPFNFSVLPAVMAGTLVKTSHGLVPIETLKIGDLVISYGPDKSLTEVQITKIFKKEAAVIFIIETDKGVLYSSKDQRFYDPVLKKWIKAKNLTSKNVLIDCFCDKHKCISIKSVNEPTTTYEISLESPHNFFISDSQILTHNFIGLSLSFAFGLGAIVLDGISLALGGVALGICLAKKKPSCKLTYKPNNILNDIFCTEGKAPGKPTEKDGFRPRKRGDDGKKRKHPETGQYGWVDKKNRWWVPTGEGSLAHGGPHWDIINKYGRHIGNVRPSL